MKPLGGKLGDVRAARLRTGVGELDRTLVVVESQELLRGQKRGIAAALLKAKEELRKLERQAASGRIKREAWEGRVQKAPGRERLAEFVVAEIKERGGRLSLDWHVDVARRRLLERTRLGRRVLSTDRHIWSTGRIAHAFPGSGMERNSSDGPGKAGWRHGVLLISGPTTPCDYTPSPP